jgi:hypothetical protein
MIPRKSYGRLRNRFVRIENEFLRSALIKIPITFRRGVERNDALVFA